MVQGNNIDPQIKQFFTDPNTGEFSRESVIQFLQSLSSADPTQTASWLSFESKLRPNRLAKKYETLFEKTTTSQNKKQNLFTSQPTVMPRLITYTYLFSLFLTVW